MRPKTDTGNAECCDERVCLCFSARLRVFFCEHISLTGMSNHHQIFVHKMAVAPFSSGGIAICYVLLLDDVIFAHNGQEYIGRREKGAHSM